MESLHDTIRSGDGLLSVASKVNGRHPLETRLQNWEETQQNARLEQYRRLFGAADPIRRTMDLEIVSQTDFKPAVLGGPANVHLDILKNKDSSIDWEDIYKGDPSSAPDLHTEVERRVGL
ncbi:unnamed protein product [Kuraishia capsulata CBS 1993]|uniref:Proteasome maturation factor UMP1 n=1 Tax=Kuraishia capsulata CBS 1993 TaxID=1382522 RepID=W6MNA2_9ASCO|nr:uncharacterized protein KUCA_T00004115001 [Kuraishia capsulata CBS 1993]CDK28134.1 unnamed protein product [Kuraishia capsulata CBS 1993]